MDSIYNFRKVSALLACSGQPTEGQLVEAAASGYETVINLGLSGAKYSLKDEAASVDTLGLAYHHIPVIFDDPKPEQLTEFINLMNSHHDHKTLVHCAANYRASVFTGLYLFSAGKMDESAMHAFIEDVWQPDAVWDQFIDDSVELLANGL